MLKSFVNTPQALRPLRVLGLPRQREQVPEQAGLRGHVRYRGGQGGRGELGLRSAEGGGSLQGEL